MTELIENVKRKAKVSRALRASPLASYDDVALERWRSEYAKAERELESAYRELRVELNKVCPVAIIDPRWNP